jgi:hypothetical protein
MPLDTSVGHTDGSGRVSFVRRVDLKLLRIDIQFAEVDKDGLIATCAS